MKNVPEEFHQRLRRCAERRGQSIRDLVLEAVRRELAQEEFVARLRKRQRVRLDRPAGELLAEVRAERESAL
ncbi:MAG: hypothetical protein ACRD2Z_08150 [Thermoanaerobaculia bacterium]